MHIMRLRQYHRHNVVYMSREALEASLISHEAMDVDQQQRSLAIILGVVVWYE